MTALLPNVESLDVLSRLAPLVDALGWTLLHAVWQGCVIVAAVHIALVSATRRPAALRYLICCCGMLAMAIAPLATFLLLATEATPQIVAAPSAARSQASAEPLWRSPEAWVVAIWLLGVAALSLRLLGGLARVQRIRRAAFVRRLPEWEAVAARLAKRMGLRIATVVAESAAVTVPAVAGWLRPVILLPAAALSGLTPAQLELILAHELAHIRRHDYLVNLLQCVVETLLFYHPGVWWLSARVREQREYCCDDLAVAACGNPIDYARALTTLETLRVGDVALCTASTGGPLMNRISRLLGSERVTTRRGSIWVVPVLLSAGALGGTAARDIAAPAEPVQPALAGMMELEEIEAAWLAAAGNQILTCEEAAVIATEGGAAWQVMPHLVTGEVASLHLILHEDAVSIHALEDGTWAAAPPIVNGVTSVPVFGSDDSMVLGEWVPATEAQPASVPLLGELPILGNLFRAASTCDDAQTDVLIEPEADPILAPLPNLGDFFAPTHEYQAAEQLPAHALAHVLPRYVQPEPFIVYADRAFQGNVVLQSPDGAKLTAHHVLLQLQPQLHVEAAGEVLICPSNVNRAAISGQWIRAGDTRLRLLLTTPTVVEFKSCAPSGAREASFELEMIVEPEEPEDNNQLR